jgi:hypothetical protein
MSNSNYHSRSLAAMMIQNNHRLMRDKKKALSDEKVKASAAIARVRKESAEKYLMLSRKVSQKLKEKNELLEEVHQMAEDVAVDYSSLARSSKAEPASLKKSTDNWLAALKQEKERESVLRENLDTVNETYKYEIGNAQEEIVSLKIILCEKSDCITELENELAQARIDIEVSAIVFTFMTSLQSMKSHFICLVVQASHTQKGR